MKFFNLDEYTSIAGEEPEVLVDSNSFEDLFFSNSTTLESPLADLPYSNIDADLLPVINKPLKEVLEGYAQNWLTNTGCQRGIDQLLSIPFHDINFQELVTELAANAVAGKWNRISFSGNFTASDNPPNPKEVGLIFDTETFVKKENKPIIATAISNSAVYIWLDQAWDKITPYSPSYTDLGGFERFIVCHSIAFDFCRVKQRFQINNLVNGLCTMAMAKALFTIDSGNSYLLNITDPNHQLANYVKTIACNMNLLDVYHMVTGKRVPKQEKKIRDKFVVAEEFSDFFPDKFNLFVYALKDTVYTLELFQNIYPMFTEWAGTAVVLQGLIQSADGLTPIIPNYDSWLYSNEIAAEETNFKMFKLLKPYAEDIHENWLAETICEMDYPDSLDKLDWRIAKPKNYRKKVLPDGYPKMARWFKSFLDGSFSFGGNDICYLLQLRWDGQPMKRSIKMGWYYSEKYTGVDTRLPHPDDDSGKKNVGNPLSGSFISYAEHGIMTSDLLPQEDLVELLLMLDSTSIVSQYGNRFHEAKIG